MTIPIGRVSSTLLVLKREEIMTGVEDLIYQYDGHQREIMIYFHNLLTVSFDLTPKITFKNPCYYGKSWICYLKPTKQSKVELAFLRGNELSNAQGILTHNGRKQLMSIEFENLGGIQHNIVNEILHEAILLDRTKPYESKRKSRDDY